MKVAQAMLTSSRALLLVLALPMLLAGGCTVLPPTPLTHSPNFAPVQPVAADRTRVATGGIYNSRVSESWFGRGRNYQVGDVITVLLSESTQAKRSQDSKVSRDSSNDVVPTGLAATALKFPGNLAESSSTAAASATPAPVPPTSWPRSKVQWLSLWLKCWPTAIWCCAAKNNWH